MFSINFIINKDKINEIRSFLLAGIVLDGIPYHDDFIHEISSFLSNNGISSDFVLDNLKDMEGHVLPVEYLVGGKAQALRNHIDLELDFFDYDEEGKVIGVSEEKREEKQTKRLQNKTKILQQFER